MYRQSASRAEPATADASHIVQMVKKGRVYSQASVLVWTRLLDRCVSLIQQRLKRRDRNVYDEHLGNLVMQR